MIDLEYEELLELIKQTTENLKVMNAFQKDARCQLGDGTLSELEDSMNEALNGWISSNC